MQSSENSESKRMPYLDGLRGYSILTVLVLHSIQTIQSRTPSSWLKPFDHAWLKPLNMFFGNGNLGVQIFFVLSGFLITTLLFRELSATGRISLSQFYKRRFARIFPAAYFYIVVVSVLALFHWIPIGWKPILAASAFCWNYAMPLHLIQSKQDLGVFNHFWTLALEEQFYFFWPGCLVLLGMRRARFVAITAVIVVPIVRVITYALAPSLHSPLPYMFQTAVDTIFWGAIAAYVYSKGLHRVYFAKRWANWAMFGWAVFTIFGLPALGEHVKGLGRFVVPTTDGIFAAMLILWLLSGDTGFVRRILEWRPLCWLGLLSYSIYIWQQIFITEISPLQLNLLLGLPLALLVATISYYWIEAPLRSRIRAWLL